MPADMAESLHDQFREKTAELCAQYWQHAEQEQQEGVAALRREWGRDFETRVSDAQRAVNQLGGDPLRELFNETGLGDHPTLIRIFADMGRLLAYEGRKDTSTSGQIAPSAYREAVQARREILRLRSDRKFMATYGDRGHRSHNIAQVQMDELYAAAYPQN